jgi:cell division protein FtsQ
MSPKLTIKAAHRSKRALANQESAAQQMRLKRLGRASLLLIATTMSFAAIGLLLVDQLYRPDAFVIDQLKIKGSFQHLEPSDIESQVNSIELGNFFSIKLPEIKQRIELMPLVQSAEVRREWPNTLMVHIKEQRPVMRWKQDKWVNKQGEVVDLPVEVSLSNPVQLSGNESDSAEMLRQALVWMPRFKQSGLALRSLSLTDSQAYSLLIEDKAQATEFDLLLGRIDVEQRLRRFLALFDYQYRDNNLKLERVDARYPDGIAVRSQETDLGESLASSESRQTLTEDSQLGNRL